MKINYHIIAVTVISLLLLSVYSCGDDNTRTTNEGVSERVTERVTERHDLAIMLVDDVWKIVDAQDPSKTEIVVSRGDTVVWSAPEDINIYFQFMDQELTGEYTQEALGGASLRLVIGENAEAGYHPYAVFVLEDSVYAVGESPPRMFIRD